MMMSRVNCLMTVVMISASLVVSVAVANCAMPGAADNEVTPISYDNTGCGKDARNGSAIGSDVFHAGGTDTLVTVKYGQSIELVNNQSGVFIASTGQNSSFGWALVDCFPPNDREDMLTVDTADCVCAPSSTYKAIYDTKYDYNTTTNFFDKIVETASVSNSP